MSEGANAAWRVARERMVSQQLRRRGIRGERVLAAMRTVPRHLFVPRDQARHAYEDHPIGIGGGQTISQPYVVAYMTDALELSGTERVLEIGTGCGYQTAILAELVGHVYTVEIRPELAEGAAALLASLGYRNVDLRVGDGNTGWPEAAPFDRILVTAAPPEVPPALVDQLAPGGRMVLPVGTAEQRLIEVRKTAAGVAERQLIPVRFVPMTSEHGGG